MPEPVRENEPGPAVGKLTGENAGRLGALVSKYVARHLPEPAAAKTPPAPIAPGGRPIAALRLVRGVPWTLGLFFALSFFWDLDGLVLAVGGTELELKRLLLVVSVSGLIGFATNWLAISMLFHPRRRRPLFGQGLIPAQRDRVIGRMAQAVSQELINEDIIRRRIEESGILPRYRNQAVAVAHGVFADADFRTEIKALAASYLGDILRSDHVRAKISAFAVEKLEETDSLAIKAYRYFNEEAFRRRVNEMIEALPQSVDLVLDEMDILLDGLPARLVERSEDLERWASKIILGFVGTLDIHGMIAANMRRYDEKQLETLIRNSTNEQLNYIKYLGGVLGTIGGLVIFSPLLAAGFLGVLALLLVGLDALLFRLRGARPPGTPA